MTNTSKRTFEDALGRIRGSFDLCVYGYVVMPEHVHLLTAEPLRGTLQHFHFWCLQSHRTQRGFSSRKAALRCPVLFRVEVKML